MLDLEVKQPTVKTITTHRGLKKKDVKNFGGYGVFKILA